jgi:hypothetical protein
MLVFFLVFCNFFLISTSFYIKLIFSSIKRFIEFPRLELLSMHFFLMRSHFVNLFNVEKNKLHIIILTKRIKIDVCVSRPKSAFFCPSLSFLAEAQPRLQNRRGQKVLFGSFWFK